MRAHHLQKGPNKSYIEEFHNAKLTRDMIVNITKIIDTRYYRKILYIKEALHIPKKPPYISE